MSAPPRIYVARLASLNVFDPLGDQVGRVRDVVVTFRARRRPRVIGLVVEVPGRRRVFVPMTRVTSVEGGQVITTGLVNMRRFEQRATETLVLADLLERQVTARTDGGDAVGATVEDVAIEQGRARDWEVARVFVRVGSRASSLQRLTGRRSGETFTAAVEDVSGLHEVEVGQSAQRLLESYNDLKPADLAEVIHELQPLRRAEVAAALDDDTLADVLQELPEDEQVLILGTLTQARAADVLEAMEPDDAADLLGEMAPERAETLLALMQPDDAAPLRRLLAYAEGTAGALMTPEPVILGPEATVAEALALVRREEVSSAIAAAVFVARPPLETPTGRYFGMVHLQRLLREPPHSAVGDYLDAGLDPLPDEAPIGTVTRTLATYNLVSIAVVDEDGRLLGAVTVDDVLDHLLPEDWREERHEVARG